MAEDKKNGGNAVTAAEAVAKAAAQAESAEDVAALKAQLEEARAEIEKQKAVAGEAEKRASEAEEEKARADEELKALSARIDGEVSRQEEAIKRQMRAQRKFRIRINSGRDANERGAVAIAVNGREYLLKRDVPVDVPEGVLNVLNLAVEQAPTPVEENGQTRVEFKDTMRFSYTVLGRVDPETGELEK